MRVKLQNCFRAAGARVCLSAIDVAPEREYWITMLPLVVLVGMLSALVFGSADFLGGLATKRISPLRVTAIAAAVGLVVLLIAYPLVGGAWSWSAVLFGGLSGVSGALAISLLYACLAIGPMSILSPVTAVVSAIVPAAIGIFVRGDHFGPLGYIAISLALVAIVLVGFVRDPRAVRPTVRALVMAVGSGTCIGLFLVIIDLTPTNSGLVPLIANRAVNGLIMFATVGVVALLARRRERLNPAMSPTGARGGGWRPGIRLAIACGVVDAIANCGLLLGIRIGDLSVIAVLTALYPAGTIILAAVVLRERIAIVQYIGLALAIGAGALLALD
jgi:drug/metabolite transporter (DMT)-like permease